MSEADTIDAGRPQPNTVSSLCRDLEALGLRAGATVLRHSSLSSLGWVCGGAVTVIRALVQALGPQGTLMMPAHSGDPPDPAGWRDPPVPESWWDAIRREMPAFGADFTPTRGIGAIAETFRQERPSAALVRSAGPAGGATAATSRSRQTTSTRSAGPSMRSRACAGSAAWARPRRA